MNIIGISGSLRKNSYNTNLLNSLSKIGNNYGINLDIKTLEDIPFFNEDLEKIKIPQTVIDLADKIKKADGLLISTPEYNGISSGVLINTLEWLSRDSTGKPLTNKPVSIIGATTGGFGTNSAQFFLKALAINLDMFSINKPKLRVSYVDKKFNEDGNLTDVETESVLVQYIIELKNKFLTFK